MAAKKKTAPPPPPPPPAAARSTTSSDEEEDFESESDEGEQFIAKPNPTKPKTPNTDGAKTDSGSGSGSESGSDSDSESESDKSRPTKPLATLQKPSKSESEDSSSEDEEDAKEEKKPKSPPPRKPSEEANQPPSINKSPMSLRIWSSEDEMTLLKALSDYKAKNGKLPPKQEYSTFLSTISSSIGFPVAENQLYNKIRTLRSNYAQKKKKGSAVTFQQPRDVVVYRICKQLFDEVGESSKGGSVEEPAAVVGKKERKKGKVEVSGSGLKEANGGTASAAAAAEGKKNRKKGKVEVNGSELEDANGGAASVAADGGKKDRKKGKVEVGGSGSGQADGGAASVGADDVGKKNSKKRKVEVSGLGLEQANGGTSVCADVANDDVDNNGDEARCHVYLADLIRNMHTQQSLGWLSPDDVMARIEESKLQDLEAKAKKLKIKEIKLHVGKAQLMGEMLHLVADAMERD